jgi:phosphate transport system permease protein
MSVFTDQSEPAPLSGPEPGRRRFLSRFSDLFDLGFKVLCRLAAYLVVALFALLVVFLFWQAWPAMREYGWEFLIRTNEGGDEGAAMGALPFIYGTLITSAIAMLIAVPLGVGTAAFLAEVAPDWMRRTGSFLVELLAAIPSVVYGFWAIMVLTPFLGDLFKMLPGHPSTVTGNGLLAAGLILAIMIVPYVTAISYDVCRAVPRSQREGSLALGATRWQTIRSVVLPYARPGIVGGCFLALGRALGETMAVIMVVGNTPKFYEYSFTIFGLGSTIPSEIALQLNDAPNDLARSALILLGVILLLVSILVNCLARVLIWRVGRVRPRRSRLASILFFWKKHGGVAAAAVEGQPPRTTTLPLVGANRRAVAMNGVMMGVLGLCLVITLLPLFLILGYITVKGVTSLNWEFFTNLPDDDPPGLKHAIVGTLMLVGWSTLVAVPIGLLTAIFLAEYRTARLGSLVRFVGELLAGVPSIIIGVFGYALMVAPVGHFSGWAAVVALGIMMIPIVMRGGEEALKLVPQSLRNASYALGAAQWQTVWRVVVPAALPAIITAIILAVARIAGETAPLLFTADMSDYWPKSMNQKMPYLTYYIYKWSEKETEAQVNVAWSAAFVLLAFIMLLNVGMRFATGKRLVSASQAD